MPCPARVRGVRGSSGPDGVHRYRGVMPTAMARRPAGIVTPEAVVLEFETAGVGSRMLARLIDGVVLWVGIMLVSLGVLPLLAVSVGGGIVLSIIVVFVMIFFMLFGYWMLTETLMRGRTPGKAAMGLRVVTVEGAPVRFRHAAIRAMVGFVDFLTPPLGPVAVLSVLASPRDQRLGDMAAGTIVVRERSVGGPAAVAVMVEPPGRGHLLAALSLSPLTDGQYRVLRSFLQRAPSLSPQARAQIGERLAARSPIPPASSARAISMPSGSSMLRAWRTNVGTRRDARLPAAAAGGSRGDDARAALARGGVRAVGYPPPPPVAMPPVGGPPPPPPPARGSGGGG